MPVCTDNSTFSFIADIAISKDIVIAAKDVVVAAEVNVTEMESAVLVAKTSVDDSEMGVEIDRDIVMELTTEVRAIEIDVHTDATLAEAAAVRAEAVVIPTEATYSMDALDEGDAALVNLILKNKADIEYIKIEGLN